MWVRFVLVPGLTDDPDDIREIARFAAGLGNVERVDVLPFHQMGRYKWERSACVTRSRIRNRPRSRRSNRRARCSGPRV
jgi:pyruvate-formate lyase-activating enzyme